MPWLRGEQSPFYLIQGLLSSCSLFQPSRCQVVRTGLCLPYFPLLCSPLVGGELRFPALGLGSHSLKPVLEMMSVWKLHSLSHTPLPQDCLVGAPCCFRSVTQRLSPHLLPAAQCFVFSLVLAGGPLHDAFTGFGALRGSLFLWTGQRKTVAQVS